MSKNITFSHDDTWTCLDQLLEKLPRSINKSRAIVLSIEEMNKKVTRKSSTSLDDFAEDITTMRLESDPKFWKTNLKEKSASELKELLKLISSRKSLVEEELYRRL